MSLTCTISYEKQDPYSVALDPDRNEFYCGGYIAGGLITVINSATGAVSACWGWGGAVMQRSIVIDTDAINKIWIGNNLSDLYVVNKLQKTACVTFLNLSGYSDSNIFLCLGTNHVLVIDSKYKTAIAMNRSGVPGISWTYHFGTGEGTGHTTACSDGTYFYIGMSAGPFGIVQLRQSDGALIRTIAYPAAINDIAYDPLQDKLWCGCFSDVVVFSRPTGNILATICLGVDITYSGIVLDIDPADGTVLAAAFGSGTQYGGIYAINTNYSVATTITPSADEQYRDIVCDPNNNTGLAAGYRGHKILFLEGYDQGC